MFERQMGEKKILEDNANMRVLRVFRGAFPALP